MLKTYRIIPLGFILFFFGFTLITVAPVLAEDSPEFVACQQIKPAGDFNLMKQKKNCFRDVARSFQGQSGDSVQAVVPVESSGGEVAQLNARIAELEGKLANKPSDYYLRQTELYIDEKKKKIAELEAKKYYLYSPRLKKIYCAKKVDYIMSQVWDHVCVDEIVCKSLDW